MQMPTLSPSTRRRQRSTRLTVAVALWGTLLGVLLGFPLALVFSRSRLVRAGCACYTTTEEVERLIEGVKIISKTR